MLIADFAELAISMKAVEKDRTRLEMEGGTFSNCKHSHWSYHCRYVVFVVGTARCSALDGNIDNAVVLSIIAMDEEGCPVSASVHGGFGDAIHNRMQRIHIGTLELYLSDRDPRQLLPLIVWSTICS